MANIHTLLEALTEHPPGTKFKVEEVGTRNEYETIRTRLVTLWGERRRVLLVIDEESPYIEQALCGNWYQEEKQASFYLGTSRRKQSKTYSFSVESGSVNDKPTDKAT